GCNRDRLLGVLGRLERDRKDDLARLRRFVSHRYHLILRAALRTGRSSPTTKTAALEARRRLPSADGRARCSTAPESPDRTQRPRQGGHKRHRPTPRSCLDSAWRRPPCRTPSPRDTASRSLRTCSATRTPTPCDRARQALRPIHPCGTTRLAPNRPVGQ